MNFSAQNQHQFALYYHGLSQILKDNSKLVTCTDAILIHRITTVLRLKPGQSCMLFDRLYSAQVSIKSLHKQKTLIFEIEQYAPVQDIKKPVEILLPLLKKESFEAALYGLTEVGATAIQLVITQKSQRSWQSKDTDRAYKIIRAAAEQSKNFAYPLLKEPRELTRCSLSKDASTVSVVADPEGVPVLEVMAPFHAGIATGCIIAVGPEGDFTTDEKIWLADNQFIATRLTTTVLRACQAAVLCAGIARLQ